LPIRRKLALRAQSGMTSSRDSDPSAILPSVTAL
jgi:hypothetical protein